MCVAAHCSSCRRRAPLKLCVLADYLLVIAVALVLSSANVVSLPASVVDSNL